MGKSDPFIFPEYLSMVDGIKYDSVAFLGFSNENDFTKNVGGSIRHFYDLSLGGWEINSDWSLPQKYDLIISTRCPYFAKNPHLFVNKCIDHTNKNGHILLEWGLGDHWRFDKFKVGWVRNGEHEYAYFPNNFLYSCYWDDSLLEDASVNLFWKHVVKNPAFGYSKFDNLKEVIEKEIPSLVKYKTKRIKSVFLWTDRPQLYIITLIKND